MVKIFKVTESLDESCHFSSLRNIMRMATRGYKDHKTGHRRRAVGFTMPVSGNSTDSHRRMNG